MRSLIDRWGRVVRDLRISVTPRCNFACTYCDPLGISHKDPPGTLSVLDAAHVVEAAAGLGMESVRFTGGEPLLRQELPKMIHHAKQVVGIHDVAITTNASLLKRRLPDLLGAGLDRANISQRFPLLVHMVASMSEPAFDVRGCNELESLTNGI